MQGRETSSPHRLGRLPAAIRRRSSGRTLREAICCATAALLFLIDTGRSPLGAQVSEDSGEEQPAARVDGVAIYPDAVHELVKSVLMSASSPPDSAEIGRLSDTALRSLVDLELLYQEALRRRIDLGDAQVDAEIARVRGHFAGDEEFEAALRRSNLSADKLRDDTRKTLLVDALLRLLWADIRVPEEEIRAFYEDNRDAFSEAPTVHLLEIVLDAGSAESAEAHQRRAEELRAQLASGDDFAELAYNYSTDRGTAARGGDRGFIRQGELPPAVAQAAFDLPVGQVSAVIASDDGLHLIQVVERRPGRLLPIDQVRKSIVAILSDSQRESTQQRFVDGLRDKAKIEIFPPFNDLDAAPATPRSAPASRAAAARTPTAGAAQER